MRPRVTFRRLLASSAVVACATLVLAGTATAADDDWQADPPSPIRQIITELLGIGEPAGQATQRPVEPADEAGAAGGTGDTQQAEPSTGPQSGQEQKAPQQHRMTEVEEEAAHRRNAPPPGVPRGGYVPDLGPPPCSDAADACVDLTDHQAWLMRDGKVIYGPVPITHGRRGQVTPPGSFHVTFKDIDHESSIYDNAPMPYSVFFNGGIAFHQGSLLVPSAGCVHLSHEAAVTFFKTLQPGEVVEVYY